MQTIIEKQFSLDKFLKITWPLTLFIQICISSNVIGFEKVISLINVKKFFKNLILREIGLKTNSFCSENPIIRKSDACTGGCHDLNDKVADFLN